MVHFPNAPSSPLSQITDLMLMYRARCAGETSKLLYSQSLPPALDQSCENEICLCRRLFALRREIVITNMSICKNEGGFYNFRL